MSKRLTFENPPYLTRMMSPFKNPTWVDGNAWRNAVRSQPVFPICRDNIIQRLLAMEWTILVKGNKSRAQFQPDIDYYTKLIEHADENDYGTFLDKVFQDALDTPFGGICEITYWENEKNMDGTPRVYGIYHVDSATCSPTYNRDVPIMQIVPGQVTPIYLHRGGFARVMYNPRPELNRSGYGMAPPEKIYLALELLVRGDKYYANLLTDTPEAGILDLMDMDEETANNWLASFRAMLTGIDPFKIPVIYEHEQPARFIPFSRPPTEMLLDEQMKKYMGIAAAGYGLNLTDLGIFMSGSKSLSSSIREERQTRRTGIGTAISKVEALFSKILPDYLQFKFQVEDEEEVVARGRARATNIMAFASAVQLGILTITEVRQQLKADNLLDIDLPDEAPKPQQQQLPDYSQQYNQLGSGNYQPNNNPADEAVSPDALNVDQTRMDDVAPSQGGMGDFRQFRSEAGAEDAIE